MIDELKFLLRSRNHQGLCAICGEPLTKPDMKEVIHSELGALFIHPSEDKGEIKTAS